MTDLTRYLCEYIGATLLGEGPVAPEEELLLSGQLDSLMVVRLIAHIEERYNVKIPATDVILENMKSADAMSGYLARTFGHNGILTAIE